MLVLASLRAVALDPHYPLAHYGYQAWQTDDGLPQNTVHAVLQTRDGFLWFATEAGLVCFDGAQLTVFDARRSRIESTALQAVTDAVPSQPERARDFFRGMRDGERY